MLDLRLPYYYNLAIAAITILLISPVIYTINAGIGAWDFHLMANWHWLGGSLLYNSLEDYHFYLQAFTILFTLAAGSLFIYRFIQKRDVNVAATLAVILIFAFLCSNLPYLI